MSNLGELIDEAIDLREQRRVLNTQVKELKDREEELAEAILEQQNTLGTTSSKTDKATAFQTTQEFVEVLDWEAVVDYVKESDNMQLLKRGVSLGAARELLAMDELPSCIQIKSKKSLNLRKKS